ncbi:MAG: YkgJ family cysteine cluster protein [Elusimicrobia bacterium]|nr:YkgJ family cysteine cluster protein [Elusimicrobiota bacterium]
MALVYKKKLMSPTLTGKELKFFKTRYGADKMTGNQLKVKTDSHDCIFVKDGLCSIYENRPLDCRAFPAVTVGNTITFDSGCISGEGWRKKGSIKNRFLNELRRLLKQEPLQYLIDLSRRSAAVVDAGFVGELLGPIHEQPDVKDLREVTLRNAEG